MSDHTAQQLKNIMKEHEDSLLKRIEALIDEKVKLKLKPYDEHIDSMQPLLTAINSGKLLVKITLWVIAFLSSIGGLVLIIKELYK